MVQILKFLMAHWWIIPVGLVTIGIWINKKKSKKEKAYQEEVLSKHGLTNSHSIITKNWIKYPNKSISAFQSEIATICQIFRNNLIIGFISKGHKIKFVLANFSKAKKVNINCDEKEIGIDTEDKPLAMKSPTNLLGVPPGAGKSTLINQKIYATVKSWKSKNLPFEIVIADSHDTFQGLKRFPGFTVYSVEHSNSTDREDFLEKLKNILEYQRTIKLGQFETLDDAQDKGQLLDKKRYLIIVDEFLENYSPLIKTDPQYENTLKTVAVIKQLVTSVRKYGQQIWVSYQLANNSDSIITPTIFLAQVFGYMDIDSARSKGLPTNHELLKTPGTFYLRSKKDKDTFFRAYPMFKETLVQLLELVYK